MVIIIYARNFAVMLEDLIIVVVVLVAENKMTSFSVETKSLTNFLL